MIKKVFTLLFSSLLLFSCSKAKEANSSKKIDASGQKKTIKVQGSFYELIGLPKTNLLIGQTEITQGIYEGVMGKNPSFFQHGSDVYEKENKKSFSIGVGEIEQRLPVENVTWYDAVLFCNKLSELEGLQPAYNITIREKKNKTNVVEKDYIDSAFVELIPNANGYRLPTSAEWEYAAFGGEKNKFSGSDILENVAWCEVNSDKKTHEVAKKTPNAFGLFDMSGNVWEWCWDLYRPSDTRRVVRGGSYYYYCTVDCRNGSNPDCRNGSTGFRIVRQMD